MKQNINYQTFNRCRTKILNLLDFSYDLNFNNKINYSTPDVQGISTSEKVVVDGKYIDYYIQRKKETESFWESFDVYIKKQKKDTVFRLLSDSFSNSKDFDVYINNEEYMLVFNANENTNINISLIGKQLAILLTIFK